MARASASSPPSPAVDLLRPAGRIVAETLADLATATDVGVNLLNLDEIAHTIAVTEDAPIIFTDRSSL